MPSRFDEFYDQAYPRKKQRRRAEKAYNAAVREGVEEQRIIDGAWRFRSECIGKDPQFIPYPASWVNAGGYDDEPDQVVRPSDDAVLQSRAWKARRGEYIPPPDERERMVAKGYL